MSSCNVTVTLVGLESDLNFLDRFSKKIFVSFVVLPSSTYLFTAGVEGLYSYFAFVHAQTHTTLGRTPLDEGSASRRDLYLTT
jgi:hypothetical protein